MLPRTVNGVLLERRSAELPEADDWLIWQLTDSAFPSGGFAHSSGLEAAWQHGEIADSVALLSFAEASLEQAGCGSLPFVTAAFDQPESLAELDRLCDCFVNNHVANRASRLQGRSFLASCIRIFPSARLPDIGGTLPAGHFAPTAGAVAQALGLGRHTAAQWFLFQQLRGLLAAAVRLGIVGPMEAQALQHRLSPRAADILCQCENIPASAAVQTAPLLDLWQAGQDRLYSRLFQS